MYVQIPNTMTFEFLAIDLEGDHVSYSIFSGNGGFINTNTGIFNLTAVTKGNFPFIVRASDGVDFTDFSFTINVLPAARVLFYDLPVNDLLYTEYLSTFYHRFYVNNTEQHTVTISVLSGSNAKIDPSSGLFYFTPPSYGEYEFTIQASNGVIDEDYSFKVIVQDIGKPVNVDNSQYFPPAIDQQGPSCTHVSLIYYLKSAIWNRQFNRDPKLPENQFSYGFVWGQNMFPLYEVSSPESAVYFMQRQGCATVSEYPLNWGNAGQPINSIREQALKYKSSSISGGDFLPFNRDPGLISGGIESLKQSLAQGNNFVLGFYVFPSFGKMTSQDNVYDCYPGTKSDSLWYNHMAVVVGYNDTIKTAHGRGAFLVLNSNTSLPGGLFYLDYNWFYFYQGNYPYYFLEENFNSNPEVSLRLSLSGIISSVDVIDNKHIFLEPSFNLSDC
jgi:hypothetical protein